ncbi:MAG: DUF3891 family protein [Methylocapsa sp.]|nr:DUF3891 family protein [Methylocapsa sp.]
MLLRKDEDGVVAIPQPSHAWLSGQLARAWGNPLFDAPSPREEVCLAAEQHDIGWLSWEMRPELDCETGLPREFFRIPPKKHTALWREGVRRARAFGRYPALLVSLHAKTIYERHFDSAKAKPEDINAVRAFLAGQRRFQARIIKSLREDPQTCEHASPEAIENNRLLIAALDKLSLDICGGVTAAAKIAEVPSRNGERIALRLFPHKDALTLEPWPLTARQVAVQAEGKRLCGRFSAHGELLRALANAKPVLLTAVLRRA